MKKCMVGCARLEERFGLWCARVTDSNTDWVEARFGKLWFFVPLGRLKARLFRWLASLDRRFINWMEK